MLNPSIMARIAGIDIPSNKRGVVALTYIYGIGNTASRKILFIQAIPAALGLLLVLLA